MVGPIFVLEHRRMIVVLLIHMKVLQGNYSHLLPKVWMACNLVSSLVYIWVSVYNLA